MTVRPAPGGRGAQQAIRWKGSAGLVVAGQESRGGGLGRDQATFNVHARGLGQPVPYINQLHPDGQDTRYRNGPANCGPTSLAMVARAFGLGGSRTDAELVSDMARHLGTDQSGSWVGAFGPAAEDLGLRAEAHGPRADLRWIDRQLAAGRLIIADGNYFAMPPHRDAQKYMGHYLVVTGKTEDGHYSLLDPMDPQARSVSPGELAAFINGNRSNGGYQVAVGLP